MGAVKNGNDDDRFLVDDLKMGCIKAYRNLFEQYGDRLYYFALGYLKSPLDAEGVVQDVFAKVWEKKASIKTECSFKSYIFTIAFNFIKKVFIKRSKLRDYLNSEDVRSSFDLSTQNQIDYDFMMDRLNRLVSRMPDRRRETFIKSRFDGLTVKEIATEMKISPKTVENQITCALKFIKANWDFDNVVIGQQTSEQLIE